MTSARSSDSEREFWVDLDRPPYIKSLNSALFIRKAYGTVEFDQLKSQLADFLPQGYRRDKIHQLLDQIRIASYEQHRINLKQALKSQKIKNQKKMHALRIQHLQLMEDLKVDYDKLKIRLTQKDLEMYKLRNQVAQQESFIAAQRISKETFMKNRPQDLNESNQKALKDKLRAQNIQIAGYKDLLQMYLAQTDHAKAERQRYSELLVEKEKQFHCDIQALRRQMGEKEQYFDAKLAQQQIKFDNYQSESQCEFDVCHSLSRRQTEMISVLQRELRNAKFVMNTPRLKLKFTEKAAMRDMNSSVPLRLVDKKIPPLKKHLDRGNKVWKPNTIRSPYNSSTIATLGLLSSESMSPPRFQLHQ